MRNKVALFLKVATFSVVTYAVVIDLQEINRSES